MAVMAIVLRDFLRCGAMCCAAIICGGTPPHAGEFRRRSRKTSDGARPDGPFDCAYPQSTTIHRGRGKFVRSATAQNLLSLSEIISGAVPAVAIGRFA